MKQTNDSRRTGIALAFTLLAHVAILLIPFTMNLASKAASEPEIKGYISGLIDLSGSPTGEPGIGTSGSGHEGGSSTPITVAKPKPKTEPSKPNIKPQTPVKTPEIKATTPVKTPDVKPQPVVKETVKTAEETKTQPVKETPKAVEEPKKETVKTTQETKTQPVKETTPTPTQPAKETKDAKETATTTTVSSDKKDTKTNDTKSDKEVKDGKSGTEASAGDKNGAGSGSGTGTGNGTGSGSGSGSGSGNGSGTGDGKDKGPGSGPKRHGLGTGQGNVSLAFSPTYPKNAQNEGVTGKVILRIILGTDGKIDKIIVQSSGDKRLDDSAIRAVKKPQYKPEEAPYHIDVAITFASNGVRTEFLGAGWEDEKA